MKKILILLVLMTGILYPQTRPPLKTGNLTVEGTATIKNGLIFVDSISTSTTTGVIYRQVDTLWLRTSTGWRKLYPQSTGEGTVDGLNRYLSNAIAPTAFNVDLLPLSYTQSIGSIASAWRYGYFAYGYGIGLVGPLATTYLRSNYVTSNNYVTFGTNSGTPAVTASVPLYINNTTGNIYMVPAGTGSVGGYLTSAQLSYFSFKADSICNATTAAGFYKLVGTRTGINNAVYPIRALYPGGGMTITALGDTALQLTSTGAGADINLSNVTSTSIPAALIPDVADTRYLGSESKRWKGLMISGDESDLDGLTFWQGTYYARLLVYTDVKPLTANRNIYVPDTSGTMLVRTNYPLSDSNGTIYSPFVLYGDNAEIGMGDSVKITDSDCPEYDGYTLVSVTTTLRDGFGSALGITAVINSPVGAPQTVTFRSIANQALGAIFYYQLFYSKD